MTRTLAPCLLLLAAASGLGCGEEVPQEEELSAVEFVPFEGSWTATVVDEASGSPVPGARVEVSDFAFRLFRETFDPAFFGEDSQLYRQKHMHVTWTDADGKVRVPDRYRSFLASQDGQEDFHALPVCGNGPPWAPIATLTPVLEQEVQVLDHRGDPVEGARVVTAEDSWFRHDRHLAMTDAQGRATLALDRWEQERIETGDRFLQVFAVGIDAATFHPGSLDGLPKVVDLHLPPYRDLHVEFRTPDGLPYQGPLEFLIQSDAPAPETRIEGGTMTGRTRLPCLEDKFPLWIRGHAMDGTLRGYLEEDLIPPADNADWTVVVNLEREG